MRMPKTVIRMRRGKPVEVDQQVVSWRKRRRKAALLEEARSEALTAILSHFDGDVVLTQQWLSEGRIKAYAASPKELLRKGRTKAILTVIKEMQDAKNARSE